MPSPYHSAPFRQHGAAVSQAATTSSAGAALPRPGKEQTVVVTNPGTTAAHFRMGAGAQTAVTTDSIILGGQKRIFQAREADTEFAVIMATGTATIQVECGDGTVT